MADFAHGHRVEQRVTGVDVAVCDQEHPLGRGMSLMDGVQKLNARHAGQPQVRDDERDRFPSRGESVQFTHRDGRRMAGEDPVVGAEAAVDRALELFERVVLVENQHYGLDHRRPPNGPGIPTVWARS
jgi:hypothetical protein